MRAAIYSLVVAAGAILFGLTVNAGQALPPAAAAPTDPPAPFTMHNVATGIRGGYQVVAVDMNKDGKVDLIGLGSSMMELLWYENPDWTPHVITRESAADDQSCGRRYRSRRHSGARSCV